jgi:diacylglycerol kinase (ATP)
MEPQKKSPQGFQRLINATGYSIQGVKAAWRNEAAFRQESIAVLILLPVALWLGTSLTQRAVLIFSLLLIPIVELLNSAIETTIDRIGLERHTLSGQAKNMGSAAVMLSLIATAAVWALIGWERWG